MMLSLTEKGAKYIAIEGVIGAGKTTLARKLAERLGAKLILENFEDNPFLEKFYKNRTRYAFHTQIYFLLSRFRQLSRVYQEDLFHSYIIADYIFEKDKIFAYLNLEDDELDLYEKIAALIEKSIRIPDLVVYLQSSVERLMKNIQQRDRDIEKSISEKYIRELNEGYNYFFFRYKATKILVVNTDEVDLLYNNEDFENLVKEITKPVHPALEYFNSSTRKIG
ncbi:MAG: deoxynucleoside kinase [Ignavibacteria bacterium]